MLIGLNGRAGAGKDTTFERIAALLHTHEVRRFSFATPLKQSVAALFDITVEQVEAWKNDPRPVLLLNVGWRPHEFEPVKERLLRSFTMREILQRYGTEAHRGVFGESFWVDQAMGPALEWLDAAMVHGPRHAVFTDVRFDNEAEAIKRAGGRVFEVVGPDGAMDPYATHASEQALPNDCLDGMIDNMVRDGEYWELDMELIPVLLMGPRDRTPETRRALVAELRERGTN